MRLFIKYFIIIYISAFLLPILPAKAAGTASIRVDMSAIGCGTLVSTSVETDGDKLASEAVLQALAENGYTAFYGGSVTDSFYLAYIANGDKTGGFNGYRCAAELYPVAQPKPLGVSTRIPEKVSAYLTAHADYFDPTDYETNFAGYLGEFVYTNGSGWMYHLNGAFLQKDLASVMLSPGDTLTLQYTLWYGADVGAAEPAIQAAFDAALAAADAGTTEAPPETTAESTTAESTTEALTTQETATTESTTEESTTKEITTEESTTEETTTEESTAEESTVEESTAEESTAEESATEALPETETAPEAKNKTYLYWVIPAAAAVTASALAVIIIKKTQAKKETENT